MNEEQIKNAIERIKTYKVSTHYSIGFKDCLLEGLKATLREEDFNFEENPPKPYSWKENLTSL